jgi:hypothetical protein
MEIEMKTKIKVGDDVYFHLEGIETFQPWREGKVVQVERTTVFSESNPNFLIRVFGEDMYRVTCDTFLFPKSGIWMHRNEIRLIKEILDSLEELSKMVW